MPLNAPLPNATGQWIRWGQLYGSAPALAITEAARSSVGPLLVIADAARTLDRLQSELTFFLGRALPVHSFPDWETLPYDRFSPHPDIVSQRLAALYELPALARGIVIVTLETLLQRLPPPSFVESHTLLLAKGDRLPREAFRARLTQAGYAQVAQVMSPGECAVRGSIIDVFPMGAAEPLRIDLFDDDIETIRTFDPDTQRSGAQLPRVRLLPAREVPLDPQSIKGFRQRYRARFEGDPGRCPVYRDVSNGIAHGGVEYYLPLFFDATSTLFDYLPANARIVDCAEAGSAAARAWAQVESRYEQYGHDREYPILRPDELYLTVAELTERLGQRSGVHLSHVELVAATSPEPAFNLASAAAPDVRLDVRSARPVAPLSRFLETFPGRTLLIADSAGRREVLLELLSGHDLRPQTVAGWDEFRAGSMRLALAVAADVGPLVLPGEGLAVLTEEQLFGERARQERRRRRSERDPETILKELTALNIGSPVVHEAYGVGRYRGLTTMEIGGETGEFLLLEYADGDKLYVPVQALNLVSRYSGAPPETAPLHKLGSGEWAKIRKRAAERIRDVAAELLDLYSRRAARQGTSLAVRPAEYRAFAATFPFEETDDQAQAIEQVLSDMASGKPMDRVICGDVGFGKTEVALRAAFVAVNAGKQVAVLVPTTLLAQQHFQTFSDRFADWPIRCAMLSRFRSAAETSETVRALADGRVDIVIATHRLLHAAPRFRDLALVIIDEEHRFGVRDKERLKALRAEVDVLTLTATPIPRTLNMALGGLRDLSLIATPPAARLAIKTFVTEWHAPMIREACLREIRRGGQIYFVHNVIESIDKMAEEIRALVPEATVGVGHGQMRERDLEQLMLDFYHRRFNLLVSTTIIESGIDIPTANTIVINRADRFGLAQLHQLRGRVGRSHHRAYAYLIAPPRAQMTDDAVKRLEAIESLEDLGAGFTLATHDLEIRGAGELLGEEQSGQIEEIGFSLYMELLERAVKALKSGREPDLARPLASGTEIDLHLPALLPETYVPDVHLRLVLYKRIASAADGAALDDFMAELTDRFGPLPEPAKRLVRLARLKSRAAPLGIRKIDASASGGYVLFEEENAVDPAKVIRLVQEPRSRFRLEGSLKLKFQAKLEQDEERFAFVADLLGRLAA
jgi:transcription-repair coupling factor (superfamily II helicase)